MGIVRSCDWSISIIARDRWDVLLQVMWPVMWLRFLGYT